MSRASFLRNWPLARRSAVAWSTLTNGEADDAAVIRAAALAVAHQTSLAETVEELVGVGEFEAVEFLLADDDFVAGVEPGLARTLEVKLAQAQSVHQTEARSRLAELRERAERVHQPLPTRALLGHRRATDEQMLDELEADVRRREQAHVNALRARLLELVGAAPQDLAIERWKIGVEQTIARGSIAAAEAALEQGPNADIGETIGIPLPLAWPYRAEPLERILGWYYGEGAIPPGFERYRPADNDEPARDFLDALRCFPSEGEEQLLRAVARLLKCTMIRIESDAAGSIGFLSDLSAPGLHALGVARWPDGVPVWLSNDPHAPDPELEHNKLLVRLVVARGLSRSDNVLHLTVDDLLAVVHGHCRRERILAHLGRQLPFGIAFDSQLVDDSVSWARSDIPDLTNTFAPTLLVGAPGMGKSTLLLELGRRSGSVVVVVDADESDELPAAPVILIDGADAAGEARLRQLVKEIHWARTTRDPSPAVVVAVRPDTHALIEKLSGGAIFETYLLSPRSVSAMREQAVTMLGWVGIEASDLGSYDRMALLTGGNPTVLFHLCGAIAAVLAKSSAASRQFTPSDLEAAWNSSTLRDALRRLLWDPIAADQGVVATLRALRDFARAGEPLPLADLTWAVEELTDVKTAASVGSCVKLLASYGLVTEDSRGISITLGGPGRLVGEWLRS